MKIFIQHTTTRKFLRDTDTWVDSCEGARHFATSIEAFRHCAVNSLADVNIIVDRGPSRPLILIPVELPKGEPLPSPGFPLVTIG
jgi:hypothetical protein